MARTVRNPMEKRTPVRTISSVMRNAPRQVFTPQRIDRSVTRKTPISQAVSSTVAPSAGSTQRPIAPITSTTKPVKAQPATTIRPASPAVKSSGSTPVSTKTPAATKPITSTTKAPTKPITSTTTKPAVSPITSKTTSPASKVTSTTKSGGNAITSLINNPIGKTLIGAGAGALLGNVLGKNTSGGTTGGTGAKIPSGSNLPSMGGGQGAKSPVAGGSSTGLKPPAGVITPKTGGTSTSGPVTRGLGNKTGDGTLTDEQVQAELDKVKASEEPIIPDGAVDNGDGTYTVVADGMRSTYDSNGSLIGMEADTTEGDTAVADGYYQDADGNIYDGQGNLLYSLGSNGEYYDASGTLIYDPNADTSSDTQVADNTWTDPETNQTWTLGADGNWTMDGADSTNTDYTVSDNTDYSYPEDTPPEESAKDGGSIKMASGGYSDTTEEVQPWQNVDYNYSGDTSMTGDNSLYSGSGPYSATYSTASSPSITSDGGYMPDGAIDQGDGTYLLGNQVYDMMSGDPLYTVDNAGNIVYVEPSTQSGYVDNGDGTYTINGTTYDMQTDMPLYRDNPSGGVDVATDNGDGTYTIGNTTYDMQTNQPLYNTNKDGAINPIQSAGSGGGKSFLSRVADSVTGQNGQNQTGVLDALKGYITQNPGLAGGAIGALLASMMDSSGGGGSSQAPVDISQMAAFAPRTTDFGPGMTGGRTGTGSPIVSYQDYAEGYGADVPDERLYSDLGISGWLNEPNMTDYVDENGNPVDQYGNALDTETPQENAAEPAEEPTMASGGPTTHYTFGRVIDPAQNLGIGQGMKKGGLSQAHTVHSHHTNPVIDDRVDFRKGSAVNGAGDGQSDDIPAWLADGEYVIDAELVSMLGNGSNKAGAKVLDDFREAVRSHKRSAPLNKIPPKAKSPLNYLKEAMNG